MAYDLQEQEQLDALKAWWQKNGNLVVGFVTVVLVAIAGWQLWNRHQRGEAEAAAALYDTFSEAVTAKDAAKARELAGTLIERHGSTTFAALAALQAAKLNFDAGDTAGAKAQLQWVVDKSGQAELALTARVRLAGVLLDAKEYDAALKILDVSPPPSHAALFADRRGDVLYAQGKVEEARAAWKSALEQAATQGPLRQSVQLKLDALPS